MKMEVVGKRKNLLAEGPHWDCRSSTLLHVDSIRRELVRYDPELRTETEVIKLEGDIGNAIPYAEDNRLLALCMERGIYRLDMNTHEKQLLVGVQNPQSTVKTRFNDGKCDALGRLWTGTMPSTGLQNLIPEKNNLWSFSKGQLTHKLNGVTISNGIAWTGDNKIMFYNYSVPRQIYVFNFDLAAGEISNRQVLVDFDKTPGYQKLGYPDGMTTDTNDKLWVACFEGFAVVQIDPETAKILTKINIPAKYATSCCFGDKNYDTLYVTSGGFRRGNTGPEDGRLYKVTELGVRGQAAYEFGG